MRIVVYVEGSSDVLAMHTLLADLIAEKAARGIDIRFFEASGGDRKKVLITQTPRKAVDILRNDPRSHVVIMPDLYPMNKGCPHSTSDELRGQVFAEFDRAAAAKKIAGAALTARFHVYCFKYDLEALVPSCERGLFEQLEAPVVPGKWTIPVQDQNRTRPPKRVVEDLFREHGKTYRGTVDAPAILKKASLETVETACPQCFGPFVGFLRSL